MMDRGVIKKILEFQKSEITEHYIYDRLADSVKNPKNKAVLKKISADEKRHYHFWKQYTKRDVEPDRFKVSKYIFLSKIFGITFGIKLMENGEEGAQEAYTKISKFVPAAKNIIKDEDEHERKLISLLDEERLKYVGSMVLGLNDALVELTGALAGFTLALKNTPLIAMVGAVTGIAAALSMAASEYLSTKTEEQSKSPLKAAIYTGTAYIFAVVLLIIPYLIFSNVYAALSVAVINAIIIIFLFTFYISVAKDIPFKKRFLEMAGISLGVAAVSFCIGFVIRILFGVEV
ncbi:VIT1/CCC1 transporter family protein [Candidatus Woesearchaeota archaeon]|nr:VIT1/CCC1 transporter family protein [Candidatus Woesearchaeota archaeon]